MERYLTSTPASSVFSERVRPYLNKWYLFPIVLFVCFSATWAYLNFITPVYKISSTLLIPDNKKGDGILKATAFSDLNMFQETKTVDNEIEILRSKDLIYKVLRDLHQDVIYTTQIGYIGKELYGNDLPFIVTIKKHIKNVDQKNLQVSGLTDSTFILKYQNSTSICKYGRYIENHDYFFKVDKGPAYSSSSKQINIHCQDLYICWQLYIVLEN